MVVHALDRAGTPYARNVGVSKARGSSILFIDHDDVAGEGYVAAMGEALRRHEFVCGRWDVERLNPEWTTALRPPAQVDGPMTYNYGFLPYAAGGTLGIKRTLFESVGGLDESSPVGADCTDLCFRVQLETKAELVYVPEAVIHYRYRHSLREMFAQARRYGRSEVGMYKRYRSRGARGTPAREQLRHWQRVIRHLPRLRHRAGRAWWFTEFGNRIGRLEGSFANLTIML
jgi:GT2 family glycosyltransferase